MERTEDPRRDGRPEALRTPTTTLLKARRVTLIAASAPMHLSRTPDRRAGAPSAGAVAEFEKTTLFAKLAAALHHEVAGETSGPSTLIIRAPFA